MMKTQLFGQFSICDENKLPLIKIQSCEDPAELSYQQNIEEEKDCEKSQIGRWNYDEQLLYLEFAKENTFALENKENRRSSKVFKQMAKIVITRSADQCRSHHQKMEKKHGSVQNILAQCKRSLERLKNKAKRNSKKNTLMPTASFLEIKESFQKAGLEMKTPMTAEPEYEPQYSPEYECQDQIHYNEIDDFLNNDKSLDLHIGVEEGESFCLDFMNYNYDPLF